LLNTLTLTQLLWPGICLVLAYVAYRAAVSAALRWNETVRLAFDRHRGSLREKAGLRTPRGRDDERTLWETYERWLSSGGVGLDPHDIFAGEAADACLTVTPAAGVHAEAHQFISSWLDPPTPDPVRIRVWQSEYVLFVSAMQPPEGAPQPMDRASLLVSDPSVAIIQSPPPVANATAWTAPTPLADIIETGAVRPSQALLWRINTLPARGTRILRYSLLAGWIEAAVTHPAIPAHPPPPAPPITPAVNANSLLLTRVDAPELYRRVRTFTFEIWNNTGAAVPGATLRVVDNRVREIDRIAMETVPVHAMDALGNPAVKLDDSTVTTSIGAAGVEFSWPLPSLQPGVRVRLQFQVVG
jgi:hypothetical protein